MSLGGDFAALPFCAPIAIVALPKRKIEATITKNNFLNISFYLLSKFLNIWGQTPIVSVISDQ